jgi:flagellar hook-length control protein FliK
MSAIPTVPATAPPTGAQQSGSQAVERAGGQGDFAATLTDIATARTAPAEGHKDTDSPADDQSTGADRQPEQQPVADAAPATPADQDASAASNDDDAHRDDRDAGLTDAAASALPMASVLALTTAALKSPITVTSVTAAAPAAPAAGGADTPEPAAAAAPGAAAPAPAAPGADTPPAVPGGAASAPGASAALGAAMSAPTAPASTGAATSAPAAPAGDGASALPAPAAPGDQAAPTAAAPAAAAPTSSSTTSSDDNGGSPAAAPQVPVDPGAPAAPPAQPAAPAQAFAPAQASTLPVRADHVRAMLRVLEHRGQVQAQLTLHPAELGGVEVRLRQTAHGLMATVTADRADSAHVLQQAGAELRRALEAQGVQVAGLDIGMAGENQDAANARANERRAESALSGPRRERSGTADTDTDLSPIDPDHRTTTASTIALGALVDVLA